MELGPEALDQLINKFMDSEEGRNLIDKLQAVLSDIKSGKLKYEE